MNKQCYECNKPAAELNGQSRCIQCASRRSAVNEGLFDFIYEAYVATVARLDVISPDAMADEVIAGIRAGVRDKTTPR